MIPSFIYLFNPRQRDSVGFDIFWEHHFELCLSLCAHPSPSSLKSPSLFKHIPTLLSPCKAKKLCCHGDSLPVRDRNVSFGGATAIFTAERDTIVRKSHTLSCIAPSLTQHLPFTTVCIQCTFPFMNQHVWLRHNEDYQSTFQ